MLGEESKGSRYIWRGCGRCEDGIGGGGDAWRYLAAAKWAPYSHPLDSHNLISSFFLSTKGSILQTWAAKHTPLNSGAWTAVEQSCRFAVWQRCAFVLCRVKPSAEN